MHDLDDYSELHLWAELNLPAELLHPAPLRATPLSASIERGRCLAALANVAVARDPGEADEEAPFTAGRLGLA